MAGDKLTVYQRLNSMMGNDGLIARTSPRQVNAYDLTRAAQSDILFTTQNKDEYDTKKLEMQQDAYLANMWYKSSIDIASNNAATIAPVQLMYRDADLMDTFPEIHRAMVITTDEATTVNLQGEILKISSNSPRIKSILSDLFIKRLQINREAPRIIFNLLKYGNHYRLMNVNTKDGYIGWAELPVYEVERLENGIEAGMFQSRNGGKVKGTQFRWQAKQAGQTNFERFQVAHFRLLTDSMFLPYGQSYLNGIRRHFRMLYMMEDAMLVYRMDRAVERRVFKVYVGNIDEKDVPQYVNQVINQTKRGSIIDPQTGQIDIRKNWASVVDDYYIPVRDMNASHPIETLQGAQNLTAIDDIKFMQGKVFTGLSCPRSFLNFDEPQGEGKNLAIQDVRFARSVLNVQMAFLSELNFIAMTHLRILGFKDDITNFSLAMNNPSQQAEQLSLEVAQKRISIIRDAVQDPGPGLPILSLQRACKMFLNMSEEEIKENLQEIRLEAAMVGELKKTSEIIKRTGLFDEVDRLYGEPGAEYSDGEGGDGGDGGPGPGGGGGGGFGGGGFGEELDSLGGPGGEGEITGEEGMAPMGEVEPSGMGPGSEPSAAPDGGAPAPAPEPKHESRQLLAGQKIIEENKRRKKNSGLDKVEMVNKAFESMLDKMDSSITEI